MGLTLLFISKYKLYTEKITMKEQNLNELQYVLEQKIVEISNKTDEMEKNRKMDKLTILRLKTI
eukprot:UN04426